MIVASFGSDASSFGSSLVLASELKFKCFLLFVVVCRVVIVVCLVDIFVFLVVHLCVSCSYCIVSCETYYC